MQKTNLNESFLVSSKYSNLNQDNIDYFSALSLLISVVLIQLSVPAGSREATSYLTPGYEIQI